MTTEGEVPEKPAYEPPSRNTTLIEALREQPNFLMQQYNQKLKAENQAKGIRRAGGVYIPPHKLRELQQEMMEADPSSEAHQKMMWQLLRKSINGIVNKVNISNIQNVVVELFNENIYRGRGLLARSIIKAQMASPNFTHVYAALIAVINTKVPEIGLLIAKRVIIQFKRSFERNNKIVCVATTKMIAHLVNQRILGEYIALQILLILLTTPTEDSVEIACDFMVEVGQMLSQITPAGATAIFQRFKGLLHEAEIQQKAQYSIQNLFAIRKTGFKEHPGVIPELDLVQAQDQITHQLDLEEELTGEENLNIFKKDPKFLDTQEEWEKIKMEILGQQNIARLKEVQEYEEQWDEQPQEEGIQDLTQQDLINLRKTIYLAIQSTVNFEECAHKIVKMNIAKGYQHELVDMILECCMMERIYQSFFGLLAERFCLIDEKFKELFLQAFLNHYNNIFKQEASKIRNLAHLFSHLFYRKALDWRVFQAIRLTPDSTTAAARMFLKILLKDIAENMGINNLLQEFQKEDMRQYYEGLFPMTDPSDLKFAINYYTAIGLGKLTDQMREVLALQEEILNERKRKQEEAMAQLLLQEEQQMMRLALEQQKAKQQSKVKQESRRDRDRSRQRRREKSRQKNREKQVEQRDRSRQAKQKEKERKRKNSEQSQSEEASRERRKIKQRQRQQEKQRKRDKQRQEKEAQERNKRKQQERKQRENEQRKERQREQSKERQREERKERQREERKERQKEERKERQREDKRRKEKEDERIRKLKEQQIKDREERKRKQRSRSKLKEKQHQKKDNKRRKRSSSSSETPVRKEIPKQKTVAKDLEKGRQRKSEDDDSSSGLSSSSQSSDSSDESSVPNQKVDKKKALSIYSDSSSDSSSSSEEVKPKQRRKRVNSESS